MSELTDLLAKQSIRELVLRYCRGIDRGDLDLVRSLYTADAFEEHGDQFTGPADAYVDWLATVIPTVQRMTHHVSNHLIDVEGDRAQGEACVTAWHRLPGGERGLWHVGSLRYLDHYRCDDGQWKFERRHVLTDWTKIEPVGESDPPIVPRGIDPSYARLDAPVFARVARQ